jgi:hypothetical protein
MRVQFEEIPEPGLCQNCAAPLSADDLCELPGCDAAAVAVVMAGGHMARGCRRHISSVSARLLERLSHLAALDGHGQAAYLARNGANAG